MPFKRCASCGKEFLAQSDSQDICRPDCAGPQTMELEAKRVEGTWWYFPLFFLCCCIATYMIYDNAYDVELFLIRNVSFMRPMMARKLAEAVPDSLDQFIDGVADPSLEVAQACLDALVETEKELPADSEAVLELVDQLRAIYEDPEESMELKKSAIAALGSVKDKESVEVLYRALNDRNLVHGAVKAFRKVGTKRAIKPLAKIVMDEHDNYQIGDIRFQAVIAVGLIPDKNADAVPALIKCLRDPSGPIRDEALTAIRNIANGWKEMTLSGRDRIKKAVDAMKLYCKSDRIFSIREKSKAVVIEIEGIMK